MEIVRAKFSSFKTVKRITHDTIEQIYPHYYSTGVAVLFRGHYSDNAIMSDIIFGKVFMIKDDTDYIGTVTIDDNQIN